MAALRERDWVGLWAAIKIGPDLRRSLESDDVAQGLLEVRALGIEGFARHADPHGAKELALLIEHGRGEAAEVLLELLAFRRHSREADRPQLVDEHLRVGDGGGREALEAAERIALDGVAWSEREFGLATTTR